MALPDVREGLGVGAHSWAECATAPHILLTDDWMQNLEINIPTVLASGVRVLVYAGDQARERAAPQRTHLRCPR